MANKGNRICCVCGEEYYYCPSCATDKLKPTWMGVFHNENCRNIYNVSAEYISNKTSKEDVVSKLINLDLSYRDKFKGVVKDVVDECFKENNFKKNDDVINSENIIKQPQKRKYKYNKKRK